jgi:hypothetical protein
MGPWPVKVKFGMGATLILLKHSLDPGVAETMVQYNTVRKMKSAFVNLYHASVENQGNAIVGGRDGKRLVSMYTPIYSNFVGRFQAGMNSPMSLAVDLCVCLQHLDGCAKYLNSPMLLAIDLYVCFRLGRLGGSTECHHLLLFLALGSLVRFRLAKNKCSMGHGRSKNL